MRCLPIERARDVGFLPDEEPEISALAKKELEKRATILTNHEVREVEKTSNGKKRIIAADMDNAREMTITAQELLIASGRGPNTDILHPEKSGIQRDERGWIIVNEYLETTQPNIWAFGDADGKYLFKHVANYESAIVYHNAVQKQKVVVDYHAVPHAVFTHPEIANVGLGEKEAIAKHGEDNLEIGIQMYEDTAKGEAMAVKDYFVKVIVEKSPRRILGGHIIGPHASVLIQEIINLMYTTEQNVEPMIRGMHIHPALNEVVERAFRNLMPPEHDHHFIEHRFGFRAEA